MTHNELAEREMLMHDMDSVAYECAGALAGIIALHDDGQFVMPERTIKAARLLVARLFVLTSQYERINAIDKAKVTA